MQIACPSCGKSHDTAQHRGAFEIECDCGYSILIPDEDALEAKPEIGQGFRAPPTALDEEDKSLSVNLDDPEDLPGAEEKSNPFAPFDGAVDMTPEEELPSGMVYDPDEADALAESKETWSQSNEEKNTFLDPFEVSDSPPEDAEDSSPLDIPGIDESPQGSPAQSLVEHNQSAAIGHLIGSCFDLNFDKLSEELLTKLATKCDELLKQNAWIGSLLAEHQSHCEAQHFIKDKKITNVPEPLALELYLYCFEIGGTCDFSPSQLLETHPS